MCYWWRNKKPGLPSSPELKRTSLILTLHMPPYPALYLSPLSTSTSNYWIYLEIYNRKNICKANNHRNPYVSDIALRCVHMQSIIPTAVGLRHLLFTEAQRW